MSKLSQAGPDEVSLGSIVGIFGTRGEVRLHLHNRESSLLAGGLQVILVSDEGTRTSARITSRPGAGGRVIGRIPGVHGRDEARALMGTELVIAKADLPDPEPDEYYHHELLGLSVRTQGGVELGELVEIHDTGQVHIWVIRGELEHFLPALAEVFVEVDVAAGTAIVADEAVDL